VAFLDIYALETTNIGTIRILTVLIRILTVLIRILTVLIRILTVLITKYYYTPRSIKYQ
jgi:hypothetical protein